MPFFKPYCPRERRGPDVETIFIVNPSFSDPALYEFKCSIPPLKSVWIEAIKTGVSSQLAQPLPAYFAPKKVQSLFFCILLWFLYSFACLLFDVLL